MKLNKFYEILLWDSKLFGYRVAQVSALKDWTFLKKILFEIRNKKIRLTYIIVDAEDKRANEVILKENCKLVDKKIVYSKATFSKSGKNSKIKSLDHRNSSKQIIALALQSGIYSRFSIDKNFQENEFEKLYKVWIKKSISREISKDVLVYKDGLEVLGIITLGEKDRKGDIGLFAVDKKARGKSIGRELLSFAEKRFFEMGYKEIQVVTQGTNIIACKFYEKNGFKIKSKKNIYHYWSKTVDDNTI